MVNFSCESIKSRDNFTPNCLIVIQNNSMTRFNAVLRLLIFRIIYEVYVDLKGSPIILEYDRINIAADRIIKSIMNRKVLRDKWMEENWLTNKIKMSLRRDFKKLLRLIHNDVIYKYIRGLVFGAFNVFRDVEKSLVPISLSHAVSEYKLPFKYEHLSAIISDLQQNFGMKGVLIRHQCKDFDTAQYFGVIYLITNFICPENKNIYLTFVFLTQNLYFNNI